MHIPSESLGGYSDDNSRTHVFASHSRARTRTRTPPSSQLLQNVHVQVSHAVAREIGQLRLLFRFALKLREHLEMRIGPQKHLLLLGKRGEELDLPRRDDGDDEDRPQQAAAVDRQELARLLLAFGRRRELLPRDARAHRVRGRVELGVDAAADLAGEVGQRGGRLQVRRQPVV